MVVILPGGTPPPTPVGFSATFDPAIFYSAAGVQAGFSAFNDFGGTSAITDPSAPYSGDFTVFHIANGHWNLDVNVVFADVDSGSDGSGTRELTVNPAGVGSGPVSSTSGSDTPAGMATFDWDTDVNGNDITILLSVNSAPPTHLASGSVLCIYTGPT